MRVAFLGIIIAALLVADCAAQQPLTTDPSRPMKKPPGCLTVGEQKVESPDLAGGDIYGAAVSIDGDIAFVGAEYDDDNGTESGSVYVYRCSGPGWKLEQKLSPADGQTWDNFGRSVSLSGTEAVVGAHFDDDNGFNSGGAYVFRFDGSRWSQVQKLGATDGQPNDRFGNSVSIDGDVLGVAAWFEDQKGPDSGAVYMFRFNGIEWLQEQKLTASDGSIGDNFGRYVSVSGNVVVIGAWKDDAPAIDSGAAYVFRHDGNQWTEEQKLVPVDAAAGDRLGWATYVLGDVAVVGSHLDDDLGTDSGSAYVYRHDGNQWNFEQKLLASDGTANEWFGYSLAMAGNRMLVAAPVALGVVAGPGAAYLFEFDGFQWIETRKITPSDGAPQDEFGFHLSMSGHKVLSGSWRDDDAGSDSGSVYFFGLGP